MRNRILVGVLNVTPDSFSDGGLYTDPEKALSQAKLLIEQGASIIDVGGQSTRPGSEPVGPDEEWGRIEQVVAALVPMMKVAVDTYRPETAEKALQAGAVMINDVSAAASGEMYSVVKGTDAKLVLMYSRCSEPHRFDPEPTGGIVKNILSFLSERVERAEAAGVDRSQLILDTGMGKFISDSPEASFEVVRRYGEFQEFGLPLYFACSRKGFLKLPGEEILSERDLSSAYLAAEVSRNLSPETPLFIRAHEMILHRRLLQTAERCRNVEQ